MVEWHNGRTAGMADRMVEWWEWSNGGNGGRNGRMRNGENGRMVEWREWWNGMVECGMAEWNGRMRNGKNGRMVEWREWYMKQSSTKGYEDELQAHFNSII
jgi:hypothetical protein